MINVTNCPACNHSDLSPFLQCKDYTVSNQTFRLIQCINCSFTITSPRPDDDALSKFYLSNAYISHTNKPDSLVDRIYLLARRYTMARKLRILNRFQPSRKGHLLDYGCGTGAFLKYCHEHHWHVTGIEPSEQARAIAVSAIGQKVYSDLTALPPDKFTTITLWHVLEHVPDPIQVLQSLSKRVSEDGTILVAVPNHKCWESKYYKEYWAGYDVPRHLWHFSQRNLQDIATKSGLRIETTLPMKLDSFYISLLSEKYRTGRTSAMGMIRAFMNGLRSNISAAKTSEYSSLIYILKK